jgi:hypothetical protein
MVIRCVRRFLQSSASNHYMCTILWNMVPRSRVKLEIDVLFLAVMSQVLMSDRFNPMATDQNTERHSYQSRLSHLNTPLCSRSKKALYVSPHQLIHELPLYWLAFPSTYRSEPLELTLRPDTAQWQPCVHPSSPATAPVSTARQPIEIGR